MTPQVRSGPSNLALGILGGVVVLSAMFAVFASKIHADQNLPSLRASGLPTSISTNVANLMGLTPLGRRAAGDFVLTDQRGHTMSLASFKGRSVVLEFMDPHCTDICPIVSREFVDAYLDLGTSASKVVFVGINVNRFQTSVASMSSYSRAHQLNSIPSWHFFTGPISALSAVWRSYGIKVFAPGPSADVQHTSVVYFIDPKGRTRFAAFPQADHANGRAFLPASQIATWGRGIALVLKDLSK